MSRRNLACGLFATLASLLWASSVSAQSFSFTDFSDASLLTLNGDAATVMFGGQDVLRLTSGTGSTGSAFVTSQVSLATDASFSTFFTFQITNPVGAGDGDGAGADGLVFVVQTVANNVGGGGGGIGYSGIGNSVGVEFDTFNNGGAESNNDIGIDLNGSLVSVVRAAVSPRFNDGNVWFAWVDYNGVTDLLEARVATSSTRPAAPTVSHVVDLVTVLGQNDAFVGFTSGTGAGGNDHDIRSWQFNPTFDPFDEPGAPEIPTLGGAGLLALTLGLIAAGAALLRRRRAA